MELLKFLKQFFLYDKGDGGGAGGDGGNPNPNPAPAPKTYNQDELNGIVGSRIAEERKKIYDLVGVKDNQELQAYHEANQTLADENATLKAQIAEYQAKELREEKSKKLTEAGIDADFVDIALTLWDGEQDLETFVKDNPKLTSAFFEQREFRGTGGSLDGKGGQTVDETKLSTAEFMEYHKAKNK